MAAGADHNDINGSTSGHVRLFEYDSDTNEWSQLGQDLIGNAAGDKFGKSVALTADGTIVASGAPRNDGNGTSAGHVRVFHSQ